MPICTSKDVPNINSEPRDIKRIYIEHTKGAWLRHNIDDETIEFWYDGAFQASWSDRATAVLPDDNIFGLFIAGDTVGAMLRDAIELGKKLRSKEIKALIG